MSQQRVSRVNAVPRILADVAEIRSRKPAAEPVIIAVVGGSASGKGHLIRELCLQLEAAVFALDDYYVGRRQMAKRGAPHLDHPRALELDLAARHLAGLQIGERRSVPSYDFATGERRGNKSFVAQSFVVIDGLFGLYNPRIRKQVDYAVFIETDIFSAMMRRLIRDAGPDGRTRQSAQDVLEMFFGTVDPAKRQFIDPTAVHAHMIVESRYDATIEAIGVGGMRYQCKALGHVSDERIHMQDGRLVAPCSKHRDVFLEPQEGGLGDELLRLRYEGDGVTLTYKGPRLSNESSVGGRPVTPAIALPIEAAGWFERDFRVIATIEKLRTSFQAGNLRINRDSSRQFRNYVEVQAMTPEAVVGIRPMLKALGLREPYFEGSYLDLVRGTRSDAQGTHQLL